jgi:hypothetical protein
MAIYLSGAIGEGSHAAAQTERRLGCLAQPGNKIHAQAWRYDQWGIDNGAYGHAIQVAKGKAEPWGDRETQAFLDYLERVAAEVDISRCRFASAPDVLRIVCHTHDFADEARALSCLLGHMKKPDAEGRKCKALPIGDAAATWERSSKLFPEIQRRGFKAALVAQDGMEDTPVDWSLFDALFIGGSDGYKLGDGARRATAIAKLAGKWVHMGRVNSLKRLKIAIEFGCDSVDGTYLLFGPTKNLPNLLGWLRDTAAELVEMALPMAA